MLFMLGGHGKSLPDSMAARYDAIAMNPLTPARRPTASMRETDHDRLPLVDGFGRVHDALRVSITDRCNIRCRYCMPAGDPGYMPRNDLLTYEEIHRLAVLFVTRFGVNEIRLTGGEPLVRRDCAKLVTMLARIEGLQDLSMTTNG
ncbi:MAG: radical SAM protein, partial [Planctomycetota bacterium]